MKMTLIVVRDHADDEGNFVAHEIDVDGDTLTTAFPSDEEDRSHTLTVIYDCAKSVAYADGVNPGWWVLDAPSEHTAGRYGLLDDVRELRVAI